MENRIDRKSIEFLSADHAAILKKFDTAVSDLEKSLNKIGGVMENSVNYENQAMAVKQYEENTEYKAFLKYLTNGEISQSEKSRMLSRSNSEYRIPVQTIAQLDNQMKYLCPMRQLAKITQISGNALDLLLDKGGTDAGWMVCENVGENCAVQNLVHMQIPVHQMYSKPRTTQKILDDFGDGVADWIVSKITQKMSALENKAFLHGNGENEPKGILSYPIVEGKASWGEIECIAQIAGSPEIEREDLFKVVSSLKAEYLPNAKWLMSRSALIAIQNIKDSQGKFLWQQSLVAGAPSCLLGYPIYISDDMPELSKKDASAHVLFGDFQAVYQIVDRGDPSILRDPYSAKPFVEFYVTKRTGGDVVNFEAIKALKIEVSIN